jgi:hypothetical protein
MPSGAIVIIENSRRSTYGYDQRIEVQGPKVPPFSFSLLLLPLLPLSFLSSLSFSFDPFSLSSSKISWSSSFLLSFPLSLHLSVPQGMMQINNPSALLSFEGTVGGIHSSQYIYSFPERYREAYYNEIDHLATSVVREFFFFSVSKTPSSWARS